MKEKILRAPCASVDEVTAGKFHIELLTDLAKSVINGTAEIGLEKLNQITGDEISGTLLTLIGGATGTALARIEKEIAKTQEMISTLQISVNSLIKQVANSFKDISLAISMSNFDDDMDVLSGNYETVNFLQQGYQAILDMCYDENGNVKELNNYEKARVDDAISIFMNNVKTADIPTMLMDLTSMTSPQAGFSTYYTATDYFKRYFPFKHQMYGNMYALYNLIATIRTIGLDMYKEYESFMWSIDKTSTLTQEDWLKNHYIPVYNSSISALNTEAQKASLINEMGTQLINVTTDDPVKYLENLINQQLTFIDEKEETQAYDVFVIDSNVVDTPANASTTATGYAVIKQALNLDYYNTSETSGGATNYQTTYHYYYNRLVYSIDHRYKAVDVPYDLNALLDANKGTDQVSYLVTNLLGLGADGNGFVLNECGINWEVESSQYLFQFYYYLKLLDANNYNAHLATPNFLVSSKNPLSTRDIEYNINVSLLNTDKSNSSKTVYKDIGLKDMKFYIIFLDTNIKYSAIPIDLKTTYYKPIISSQMPSDFNMDNGDVLDLSALKGTTNGHTINISGNVRIIGGGANNALSDLNINLYQDAVLTLEDLYLNVSEGYKINVKTGTGTIITAGSNKLTGTVSPISSEDGANITIKEENDKTGSFIVECTSPDPAISSGGDVNITRVSNLCVSSKGETSINSKRSLNATNSTITSIVEKEGNYEFKAGASSYMDNTVFNMCYGIFEDKKICFSNSCRWTGNVRYKVSIHNGLNSSGTKDRIDMRIKNDKGDILQVNNITELAGGNFAAGSDYALYFSKKAFNNNYASVTFVSFGTDGWYPSYCSFDSATFSYDRQSLYKWINIYSETTFYPDEICGKITIKTANVKNAGTDSAASFSIVHGGGNRTPLQRFDNTLNNNTLEQNATEDFTVNLGRASKVKDIEGLIIKSNYSGNNPGWKVESIKLESINNVKDISLAFFPNLWIVNTTEKLFGLSEATTGLFEFSVKTGSCSNAGTDATLYVTILGTNGSTNAEVISGITDYDAFEKNYTDVFSVAYSKSIGTPQKITITTKCDGSKPGWYCEYIDVRALVPNENKNGNKDTKKYRFNVNSWIENTGVNYTYTTATTAMLD